jgi:hypothetical protein
VVVHCADCALLDHEYYEPGEQEMADTPEAAQTKLDQLAHDHRCRPSLCAWCRPCTTATTH